MKKIAYILAYIGSICTIVLSIISALVTYSYYLDQPTSISERSIISSIILIILSIIILILIHKLDFKKNSSSVLIILITTVSLMLPGILRYEAKLRYLPEHTSRDFYSIISSIIYSSLDYFPLVLVILAGILFLIPNSVKRKF